jgi:hypothetical protein
MNMGWMSLVAAAKEWTSADSRQFYTASFNPTNSLGRKTGSKTASPDIMYDVETLVDGTPASLAAAVEQSPVRCATMRCVADLLKKGWESCKIQLLFVWF